MLPSGRNRNLVVVVKSSWKRKRDVRRLEKGLNSVSIHSNNLQIKLLWCWVFVTEIGSMLGIGFEFRVESVLDRLGGKTEGN